MQAKGDLIRFPEAADAVPSDFAAFFAEEHRGLYKALYCVTGNREDGKDLSQDASLKLWERCGEIDQIEDPTGYVSRMALNGFRVWLDDHTLLVDR